MIAYSMVSAVGYAAIAYFIEGRSDGEVRAIFDQVRDEEMHTQEAESGLERAKASSDTR